MYNPILALVKASILLFILRLSGQKRSLRIVVWTIFVINVGLMIAVFIAVVIQCTPISFNWDRSVEGHCIAQSELYVAQSATTIVTDIIVLFIPIWIVMDLRMKKKMKAVVIGVFFLGFL